MSLRRKAAHGQGRGSRKHSSASRQSNDSTGLSSCYTQCCVADDALGRSERRWCRQCRRPVCLQHSSSKGRKDVFRRDNARVCDECFPLPLASLAKPPPGCSDVHVLLLTVSHPERRAVLARAKNTVHLIQTNHVVGPIEQYYACEFAGHSCVILQLDPSNTSSVDAAIARWQPRLVVSIGIASAVAGVDPGNVYVSSHAVSSPDARVHTCTPSLCSLITSTGLARPAAFLSNPADKPPANAPASVLHDADAGLVAAAGTAHRVAWLLCKAAATGTSFADCTSDASGAVRVIHAAITAADMTEFPRPASPMHGTMPIATVDLASLRPDLVKALEKLLEKPRASLAVLEGEPGAGEAMLARQYAAGKRALYRVQLWLSAWSEEALGASIADAAVDMGIPLRDQSDTELAQAICAALASASSHQPALLVFHAARDASVLAWPLSSMLRSATGSVHTLVTCCTDPATPSTSTSTSAWPRNSVLRVPVLREEQAIAFLRDVTMTSEQAQSLAKQCGGRPLLLRLAACCASSMDSLVSAEQSVDAAVTKLVKHALRDASPLLHDVMRAAAFLAPGRIPPALLLASSALPADASRKGKAALRRLVELSLIHHDGSGLLRVHPRVQAACAGSAAQSHLSHADVVHNIVTWLTASAEQDSAGTADTLVGLQAHILTLCIGVGSGINDGPEAADAAAMLTLLGKYMQTVQKRWNAALPMFRRNLIVQRAIHSTGHARTAAAMRDLASCLADAGHLSESEAMLLEAQGVMQQRCGDIHPDTLATMRLRAGVLAEIERFPDALALLQQVLQLQQRIAAASLDSPTVLIASADVARGLVDQGDVAAALDHLEPVALRMRRVLGDQHTEYARVQLIVAAAWRGKAAAVTDTTERSAAATKAVAAAKHASEVIVANSGMDSIALAIAHRELALCLLTNHQAGKALHLLQTVRDCMHQCLGSRHRQYAVTLYHLALCHAELRDMKQARSVMKQALAVVLVAFPDDDHPARQRFQEALAKLRGSSK